jgi:hypothetical protein
MFLRNRGIQGPEQTADTARARGPRLALGGLADEAYRRALRDKRQDRRTSQGGDHAKDAGAQYFPPLANDAQPWTSQWGLQ